MYVAYIRKRRDGENFDLGTSKDLHVISTPKYCHVLSDYRRGLDW
jgi:hypothetical protein